MKNTLAILASHDVVPQPIAIIRAILGIHNDRCLDPNQLFVAIGI